MRVTKEQATALGDFYKIDFNVIKFDEWLSGLNIELEHLNVTGNSLKSTAKIVIAHLLEDPRYYHYLIKLEKRRETYWNKHKKPCIFKNN